MATTYAQPHFRIRSDDTQTINADAGWAAALDTNITHDAAFTMNNSKAFRIRFEVEETTGTNVTAHQFKLQYRRNGGTWIDCVVNTVGAQNDTDWTFICASDQYAAGAATTNVLAGSGATFEAGEGREDNLTASHTLSAEHTEFEWPIKIPIGWGEGVGHTQGRNSDGDTFEYRVVQSDGTVFAGTYVIPTVTLNIPDYQIGGSVSESPNDSGPFIDGNNNLYFIEEYAAESGGMPHLLKSADNGKSWSIMTGGTEPTHRDLEAVDVKQVGTTLYIFNSSTSDTQYHSRYNTSDHSTTPDQWQAAEQLFYTPSVNPSDQKSAGVVRSDGTMVAFINGDKVSALDKVWYYIRSSGGTWDGGTSLDTAAVAFTDVWVIKGANDLTHIFYQDQTNKILYHRSLTLANSLSARTQVATSVGATAYPKPIVGVVYYDDEGVETIMVAWVDSAALLWSATVLDDGAPGNVQQATSIAVGTNRQSGMQACADLVLDGKKVYLVYSDASTSDLWMESNTDAAGWSAATEILDNTDIQQVRGRINMRNGAKFYMYTYDLDPLGYSNNVWYGEYLLSAASPNFAPRAVMAPIARY